MHGAIQGYTDSNAEVHIYSERDSEGNLYITWLTTWLYKIGLTGEKSSGTDMTKSNQPISIDMDRAEQYLAENNRSAASPTVLCNIKSIAELITT